MSLADFLGIKKFGQGVASTIRNLSGEVGRDIETQNQTSLNTQKLLYAAKEEKDPAKKDRLLKLAHSIGSGVSAEDIDSGLKLSNKEILGSAANVALNVAMPGAFKGGKAAVVAKNAVLGAGFGTASGLEKNRSAGNIVGSAVGGAAVGAGIGVAGLMATAAKDFVGKRIPEWMMNKAIKPALHDLKKNLKYGTNTLSKELLDEGVKGGPRKLLQIADDKLTSLEDELQAVLNSPTMAEARITRDSILPYLDDLMKTKKGIPGLGGEAQRIEGLWKTMPEQMTLQQANQMKRRIYSELRDVAYKLDSKLTTKASTLKIIAKGLKTEIENTVGGNIVADINRKLSIYGRLENAMVDQLAREMRNNGISLTDAILFAGGDTTSVLALVRHLGQGIETNVAQALSKTQQLGTGAIGRTTKELGRRAGFNIP